MPFIVFRLKGIHIRTLKFYSQASFNNPLREDLWIRLSLRDYKSPLAPPPSPSVDHHFSKCYNDSIVEDNLLWNSTMQFFTLGGSLAIDCILFWTSSLNLSLGKTSVTNPQSLASTAVSLRPASNISLD